jgi:formate hydrogenlyase subunit 4
MDLFFVLIFFVAFCFGIYKWAESKGRNAIVWTLVAVIISPLITALILLFVPKTIEKQAEEAKLMQKLMGE